MSDEKKIKGERVQFSWIDEADPAAKEAAEKAVAHEAVKRFLLDYGFNDEEADAYLADDARIDWTYTCGLCGDELHPDAVKGHVEEHKADPNWPGYISMTRTDAL
jgi:hypothetical protein